MLFQRVLFYELSFFCSAFFMKSQTCVASFRCFSFCFCFCLFLFSLFFTSFSSARSSFFFLFFKLYLLSLFGFNSPELFLVFLSLFSLKVLFLMFFCFGIPRCLLMNSIKSFFLSLLYLFNFKLFARDFNWRTVKSSQTIF